MIHVGTSNAVSMQNVWLKIIEENVFVRFDTQEIHTEDADPTKTHVNLSNVESTLNARSKIIGQDVFVYLNTLETHTKDADPPNACLTLTVQPHQLVEMESVLIPVQKI